MKEIYYIYNNEAIASCIILDILQRIESIDMARVCLILPFLLDDRTVNYLQSFEGEQDCLTHMIKNQPRLFTSLNKRYLALLPVLINSLMILNKNNQIRITPAKISIECGFLYEKIDMGERFEKIRTVMPIFLKVIEKYSTLELYRILKIQL